VTPLSQSTTLFRRNIIWTAVLLAIVALDVVGILFTLAAERRLNASFRSEVTDNVESNSRESAIHELAALASDIGPGERAQSDAFFEKLAELRGRTENTALHGDDDWGRRLDEVASKMHAVVAEAVVIEKLSGAANFTKATAHWEVLHSRRNAVHAALNDIDESLQSDELGVLLHMSDTMPDLIRLQNVYGILVVILLLVIGGGIARVVAQLRTSRHRELSEERLKLATNATTDGIFDWQINAERVWCNDRFSALTGIDADAAGTVDGNDWFARVHPDDLQRLQASLASLQNSGDHLGDSWAEDYRLLSREGTYILVEVRGQIIRDAGGVARRLVGAISDTTERRLAAAQMAALSRQNEMILNTAGDGIFGVGMDGRPTFVNPAASRMTGFTLDDMRRLNVHATLHRNTPEGAPFTGDCQSCDAVRDGVTVPAREGVFWRADGAPLLVEYTITPMRGESGQTVGAVITFRDDSQRRAMDKMKSEFISVVSHELRTPLTSLRGALGLLAGGLLDQASHKRQRMLEIAVTNTERLIRLINDILDIERVDSGTATLVRTTVSVAEVLRHVGDLMQPIADKAAVRLSIAPHSDQNISADSDRVVQTLTNLVSNAIKFSPPNTDVRVTAEEDGDAVRFAIRDQGRGIPADKFDMIFERFQQVDASDAREKGGSGLGLAICRSIVKQHGGELGVESVVGEGSVFHFTIPKSRAAVSAAVPSGPREIVYSTNAPAGHPSILVVEDDVDLARVICESLASRGISTRHAENGRAAIAMSSEATPDLLILDLDLPDVSGFAVVQALRGENRLRHVPLVVYSAKEPTHAEMDRLRLGRTEFMTKSCVRPEEFERRVVELLNAIQESRVA
jgi:PAS domain S-box-containing protein